MLKTGVHYSKHIAIAAIFAALIPAASAKDKKTKEPPKDEIEVVGHVPLTDGPVRRLLLTEHYSRSYLYAERDAGRSVTLIDVTRAAQPSVVSDLANAGGDSGNLTMVPAPAALVSSTRA